MGKEEIQSKLRDVLMVEEFDEINVVYILRSIRKVLDLDNSKEYKKLRFYCNWALHIQIDETNAVSEELEIFPDDIIASHKFLIYESFHKELRSFLEEYGLKTNIYKDNDSVFKFNKILTEIYTDTPLVIKSVKKKIITLKSGEYTKENVGGIPVKIPATTFTVTYEG